MKKWIGWLLFFRKFEIRTTLSPQEARRRLFAFSDYEDRYGQVAEDKFVVGKRQPTHGRNSFVPMVRGRIVEQGSETVVLGTWRMHLVVQIFCLYWQLFVLLGSLLIPPALLLFVLFRVLIYFAFERPMGKLHAELESLLKPCESAESNER